MPPYIALGGKPDSRATDIPLHPIRESFVRHIPTSDAAGSFTQFLQLPPELQLQVIKEAVVSDKAIIDLKAASDINYSLLLVNRWILKEGLKFYYRENVFHFTDLWILVKAIEAEGMKLEINPIRVKDCLRNISTDVIIAEEVCELPEGLEDRRRSLLALIDMVESSNKAIYMIPKVYDPTLDLVSNIKKIYLYDGSSVTWWAPLVALLLQYGDEVCVNVPIQTMTFHLRGASIIYETTSRRPRVAIFASRDRSEDEEFLRNTILCLMEGLQSLRSVTFSGLSTMKSAHYNALASCLHGAFPARGYLKLSIEKRKAHTKALQSCYRKFEAICQRVKGIMESED